MEAARRESGSSGITDIAQKKCEPVNYCCCYYKETQVRTPDQKRWRYQVTKYAKKVSDADTHSSVEATR